MSKFKVGDKVRVRKDLKVGKEYGDLSLNSLMAEYRGRESVITTSSILTYTDNYLLEIDGDMFYWSEEMLEPADAGYQVKDILVQGGDEYKVLAVCGLLYALSGMNNFTGFYGDWYTKEELASCGYKLKEPEPEVIPVLGKKYKRKDVEERLKKLKEVED